MQFKVISDRVYSYLTDEWPVNRYKYILHFNIPFAQSQGYDLQGFPNLLLPSTQVHFMPIICIFKF